MKKILFILTLFIGQFIYGQQITSALNAKFYVQGISVNDTIIFLDRDSTNWFTCKKDNYHSKYTVNGETSTGKLVLIK
jgi:hypothetical protein